MRILRRSRLEGYHGVVHVTGPRNSLQWEHNLGSGQHQVSMGRLATGSAWSAPTPSTCRNVETEIRTVHGDLADPTKELIQPLYFPYGAADARVEVTKAISEDPDVFYFCQWGKQQVVAAIKAARELGFEGPIVVTVYDTPEAQELGPELAVNSYGACGPTSSTPTTPSP